MDKQLFKKVCKYVFLQENIKKLQEKLEEKTNEVERSRSDMEEDLDRFFDDYIFAEIKQKFWDLTTNYLTKEYSKKGGKTVAIFLCNAIIDLYSNHQEKIIVALPKNKKITDIIFGVIEKEFSIKSTPITGDNAIYAQMQTYKGYHRKNWEFYSLTM